MKATTSCGAAELNVNGDIVLKRIAALTLLILFSQITAATARQHFQCATGTGENATIIIPAAVEPTVAGTPIAPDDEIAVFTPDGLCAGVARWKGVNIALTAWGNNYITQAIDGLRPGDQMHFKIWRKASGEVFEEVNVSYASGDGSYKANGLYQVASLDAPAPAFQPPVPVSPAAGAQEVDNPPELTWQHDSPTATFSIEVAADSAFSQSILRADLEDNFAVVGGLQPGEEYFWRVLARDSGLESDWSATFSFRLAQVAPPRPNLDAPANASSDYAIPVQLNWHAAEGATRYRLQISSSSAFTSANIVVNRDLTSLSTEYTTAEYETTYYWRVRGSNDAGNGPWSDVWHFETSTIHPRSPKPVSPEHGATGVPLAPVLKWEPGDHAEQHHVQVARSADFSDPVVDEVVADPEMTLEVLEEATVYYWRVRSVRRERHSEWMSVRTFTTLGSAVTVSPAYLDFGTLEAGRSDTGTIRIENAADATTEIAFNVGLPSEPFRTAAEAASFTLAPGQSRDVTVWFEPTSKGTYSSKVVIAWQYDTIREERSVELAGMASAKEKPPVHSVAPAQPANGSRGVSRGTVLRWKSVDEAVYDLQISLSADFEQTAFEKAGATDTLVVPGELEPFTEYHWRVRARRNDTEGPWSPAWTFRTALAAPGLLFPDAASPADPKGTSFAWRAVNGAEKYEIRLSTEASFNTIPIQVFVQQDTTFSPEALEPSQAYYWSVRAHHGDEAGPWAESGEFTTASATGVESPAHPSFQASLYPNPAADRVHVAMSLPEASAVEITVFDALGRAIMRQVSGTRPAGAGTETLDLGASASGVVWVRIETETSVVTLPLVLLQ